MESASPAKRGPTCAMPKPPKAVLTGEAKSRGQHSVEKLRLYEILYTFNQGFEQVLGQLQLLESSAWGTSRGTPSA
jgi:hypothetical protein